MPKLQALLRIDQRNGLQSADATQTILIGGANADLVDGIDASRIPRPNTLLALDANAKFPSAAIPWPRANAVQGHGGRTIFGPGSGYLVEAVDAATTTWAVSDPVWAVDEYLMVQTATGTTEKVKVTAGPTFAGAGRYEYTVSRNADGNGAHSFAVNQVVVSLGAAGQGYIAIDAQGHKEYRAFIEGIVRNSDSVSDTSIRWRLGNLEGLWANGIETEIPAPDGVDNYGLWTDNIFAKGTFFVQGASRITGSLSVGYPGGPEVVIGKRTLPNGETIHNMEWKYEPNRRWWVQWYNETNQRIFWRVTKPQTATSPEEPLINLQYRDGVPADGEPDEPNYYLNIDAKTIIGYLIADRLRVTGALSVMAPDFGTMTKAAFEVANVPYSDVDNRDGVYIWAGQTDRDSDIGVEFWYQGTRQGRWLSSLGALTFGAEDSVKLTESGMDIDAFEVADAPDPAGWAQAWAGSIKERSLSWLKSGQTFPSFLMHGSASPNRLHNGVFSVATSVEDESTFYWSFHDKTAGGLQNVMFIRKPQGSPWQGFLDRNMIFQLTDRVGQINFPGASYLFGDGWTFTDLTAATRLTVPGGIGSLTNRQFAVGVTEEGYQVAAWGLEEVIDDATGETEISVNMIGIDRTNNRLVMQHGDSGWYYVAMTAVP